MTVEAIIQLVATIGIIPTFCVALIALMFKQQKRLENFQETALKNQRDQEERLTLMTKNVFQSIPKEHTKEEEEDSRRLNTFIDQQLASLLRENCLSRCGTYLYHNGGYTLSKQPFFKFSLVCEATDIATRPVIQEFQSVPRAMLMSLINEVAEKGEYYIRDVETIKESDNATYNWLIQRGTKSAYIKALVDNLTEMTVGFIVAEYTSNEEHDFKKLEISLNKKAQRIAGALQIGGGVNGGQFTK